MNMHVSTPARAAIPTDRELIILCRRAKRLLEADLDATNRLCDVEVLVQKRKPKPPRCPDMPCLTMETRSSELRRYYREGRGDRTLGMWRKGIRAKIAIAVAYEHECRRVKIEAGLYRAKKAACRAGVLARGAVERVVEVKALTLKGAACKAALVSLWLSAGYGFHDEGSDLAVSVVEDVRKLGTGGWPKHPVDEDGKLLPSGNRHAERDAAVTRDEASAA